MATAPQLAEPEVTQQPEVSDEGQQENQYGENNETLPDELQAELKTLARMFCEEDRYSRRLEIQECRRARFFWRGLQHLYWDYKSEGWQVFGPAGMGANTTAAMQDSAVLYVTNIYQAFGLSIMAVLTQNMPSVRFEPQDPNDAADIETAKAAERMRKIIEHQNDAVKLLTETAYYSWNDGRIGAWTRFETDPRTQVERETISIMGVLEFKVPITAECMERYPYLQYSDELHVSLVRDEVSKMGFPQDYEKKIEGGARGQGEDVYERTARISVKQGVSLLSQSGDTISHLVTRQQTWLRPAAFEMVDDDTHKMQLKETFPNGCRVRFDSGIYTGSWQENMQDSWAVMHPLPGDGQYRNAIGTSMISVQERFNDIVNITQDVYEKTIPAAWADDGAVDIEAFKRQVSKPGARYGATKKPNEALSDLFFYEPPAEVSPDMLQYAKELMGEVSQFLTGAFPALFGGNMEDQKTATGYAMARDQAMGRIGLVWRSTKRFWARVMEQAVRCAAKNRTEDVSMGVPDEHGNVDTTQVRIEELKGNIFCFPDTDENFPESYSQKRAALMQLMPMADQDPLMAKTFALPQNQEVIRSLVGLEDFDLAGADARDKQLAEINIMLKSVPVPNPEFENAKMKLAQLQQHSAQGNLAPDGMIEQLGAQLQSTPPLSSSIPIDPVFDDNADEFQTVQAWINSPEGQKMKKENPVGFQNIRLHGLEHQAALKAQMAAIAPPAPIPAGPPKGAPVAPVA